MTLGPRFGRVLVANGRHRADFFQTSQHLGSNVGTARVVADIFRKQLFAPIRSGEARLDSY